MKKHKDKKLTRCAWPGDDALMVAYHDNEWGVPQRDDKILFEYIVLDTFQAGLSWQIILRKREGFRKAFRNFDYKKVAKMTDNDVERLMLDASIIRNRLKIDGTIKNAKAFLNIQKELGSFSKYLWQFVGNKPIINNHKRSSTIGSTSKLSDRISKDMKKRGLTFVGSTIIYAFMQGAGLVNDHLVSCFRHKQVRE